MTRLGVYRHFAVNLVSRPRNLITTILVLFILFVLFTMNFVFKEDRTALNPIINLEDLDIHQFHRFSTPGKKISVSGSYLKKNKHKRDSRLGKLYGGPSNCQLYSPEEPFKTEPKEMTKCVSLQMEPRSYVCIHPFSIDKHISFSLAKDGLWEKHTIEVFKKILLSDKELGVFDIGANVGIYSIIAASMGHKVVAIEPHTLNLEKLHMAIQMNNISKNVVLLQNAISNKRGAFELYIPPDNQGGVHLTSQDADRFCKFPEYCPPWTSTIVLNDLLEVTNFDKAVIKVDVEGHEHKIFRMSKLFFQHVKVTHILMEWSNLRRYYGSQFDDSEDKKLVFEMIHNFKKEGFCAVDALKEEVLSLDHWYSWPDDIIWIHSNYSINGNFMCK